MPRAKQPSLGTPSSPSRHQGSAEIAAVVARTAPAVLELLADGVARSRGAIVATLAGRHAKDDIVRTLMRLAVTGRVVEAGGRYTLVAQPGPDPDVG
jgi:hypothetical protein